MSKTRSLAVLVTFALGYAAIASAQSVAGVSPTGSQKSAAPLPTWVAAQQSTPGIAQTAHSHITGTAKAGAFEGSGAALSNLNAAALAAGTVPDARLSANVLLSSAIQTITGVKTFSAAPSFTDATTPFTVSSSNKVANLNADRLDGLDSTAFLQAVPVPLILQDSEPGSVLQVVSTAPNGAALYAVHDSNVAPGFGGIFLSYFGTGIHASSSSGPFPGVRGISYDSNGVDGNGGLNGVQGTTANPGGSGVYGQNDGGGYGVAGRGSVGVLGQDNTSQTSTVGVWGVSTNGYGLAGQSSTGLAVWAGGDAWITGDLTVGGSKFGYVVDLVKNADSLPLEPGAVVEIVGHEPAVVGTIPVTLVRNATSARASAVLGPIDCAVTLDTRSEPVLSPLGSEPAAQVVQAPSVQRTLPKRATGSVAPGAYGNVVTLGAFRAVRVDASFGAIRAGDMLVASPNPGYAMVSHDPRLGTVIGKALGDWSAGLGEVPLMVASR